MSVIRVAIVAAVLLAGIVMSSAEEPPMKRPPQPKSHLRPPLPDSDVEELLMMKKPPSPKSKKHPPLPRGKLGKEIREDVRKAKHGGMTKRAAGDCINLYATCFCYYHKLRGLCESPNDAYRNWMERYCSAACGMCAPDEAGTESCVNKYGDRTCNYYVEKGFQNDPRFQYTLACGCPKACGLCEDNTVPSIDEAVSSTFKQECLTLHNQYRSQHNAVDLTWDDKCAQFAQEHADAMKQQGVGPYHSNPRDRTWMVDGRSTLHGENIAFQHPSIDVETAINKWYNEKKVYNQHNPVENFNRASHFTQLVWKSTTKVGCGKNSLYVVCIYGPAGNTLLTSAIQANVDP